MKRERLHTVEVDDVLLEGNWSSSTEGDDCKLVEPAVTFMFLIWLMFRSFKLRNFSLIF